MAVRQIVTDKEFLSKKCKPVEKFDENARVEDGGYFYIKNAATGYYDKYDDYGELMLSNINESVVGEKENECKLTFTPRTYYARYDLYNKLFVYVKAKVNESYSNNSPIFEQREIFGEDVYSVVHSFVRRVLISENIVKYKFNEVYDYKQKKYKENIIGLIK